MRALGMLGVVAFAAGAFGLGIGHAQDDPGTSYMQPANTLVMPFDATANRQSFFVVSNISGISPTADPDRFVPAVSTHWSYWSDDCRHLVDVYACLTLNDTVVVDPTNIQTIDAGNNPMGPMADLSGQRGFVVVTAYSTGEVCADASYENYLPIDDAIVGSYTLADTASGASIGSDAIGLGLNTSDPGCPEDARERYFGHDCHTNLPDIETDAIDIQTFSPGSLDLSAVVLLNLQEHSGSGHTRAVEVGPAVTPITFDATYYDNVEAATSLPDVSVGCAEFTTLLPGAGGIIPGSIPGLSSGIVRLGNPSAQLGGASRRFVYAVYGQAIGQFGAGSNGKYGVLTSER